MLIGATLVSRLPLLRHNSLTATLSPSLLSCTATDTGPIAPANSTSSDTRGAMIDMPNDGLRATVQYSVPFSGSRALILSPSQTSSWRLPAAVTIVGGE